MTSMQSCRCSRRPPSNRFTNRSDSWPSSPTLVMKDIGIDATWIGIPHLRPTAECRIAKLKATAYILGSTNFKFLGMKTYSHRFYMYNIRKTTNMCFTWCSILMILRWIQFPMLIILLQHPKYQGQCWANLSCHLLPPPLNVHMIECRLLWAPCGRRLHWQLNGLLWMSQKFLHWHCQIPPMCPNYQKSTFLQLPHKRFAESLCPP